jgi:beta-aspartyl-peptidase (threonine type)
MAGVLEEGKRRQAAGQSALDVCEALIRMMEDDGLFNCGKGATLTSKGEAELDASIMDGATLKAGAVACVKTVRHPISLARLVMERTAHVLLVADGAEAFATSMGVERVPNSYFVTPRRKQELENELKRREGKVSEAAALSTKFGTVGVVCLDSAGHLGAATSTGGITGKMPGRVGDSPIIGAGTFADGRVAVSCTGLGEQFIRHSVAGGVATRMRLLGESVKAAADYYVFKALNPGDGGLIAVDSGGNIAMPYSSAGMYRAAADSAGRSEVRIWEE